MSFLRGAVRSWRAAPFKFKGFDIVRKKAVIIVITLVALFALTVPYCTAFAAVSPSFETTSETTSETVVTTTETKAEDKVPLTKFEKFKETFYRNFIKSQRYMLFIKGLGNTLLITVLAVLVGIVLGFLTASVRYTYDEIGGKSKKGLLALPLKFLNFLCRVYLTVVRGTPMMVQLLIIYYVIFASVSVNKVVAAVIGFGINSGAYVAEIVRSGLTSIDRGQMEAGRSLGLGYIPTMVRIIIPQAFKNILPALGNELIVLLKETSISGYIALSDLTRAGDSVRSDTYSNQPLIAVALIYLAVVMVLAKGVTKLELYLRRETKGSAQPVPEEPQEENVRRPEEWLG